MREPGDVQVGDVAAAPEETAEARPCGAEGVVQHAHGDASFRAFGQHVHQPLADRVVVEDVSREVDVGGCRLHGGEHFFECGFCVVKNLDVVSVQQWVIRRERGEDMIQLRRDGFCHARLECASACEHV